jgi:hypothetical protein
LSRASLGARGRPKKGEEKAGDARIIYNTKAHILARLDRDGHAELAAMLPSRACGNC